MNKFENWILFGGTMPTINITKEDESMGQLKQMHIDCYVGECLAGAAWHETCYKQPDNPSYNPEDGDYDARFDEDQE